MARIAFVLADDFEDSEFRVPYDRLREAGHDVTVIGLAGGAEVRGKKGKETFTIEATSDRTDLRNAGAEWVDREVVEDGNLITSPKPDDLDAFTSAILARLS